jgi:hypothetical protein
MSDIGLGQGDSAGDRTRPRAPFFYSILGSLGRPKFDSKVKGLSPGKRVLLYCISFRGIRYWRKGGHDLDAGITNEEWQLQS